MLRNDLKLPKDSKSHQPTATRLQAAKSTRFRTPSITTKANYLPNFVQVLKTKITVNQKLKRWRSTPRESTNFTDNSICSWRISMIMRTIAPQDSKSKAQR
jgi:hypothetical protein